MRKKAAAFFRAVIFICIFTVIFVAGTKVTGVFDGYMPSDFQVFGSETETNEPTGEATNEETSEPLTGTVTTTEQPTTAETTVPTTKETTIPTTTETTVPTTVETTADQTTTLPSDNEPTSAKTTLPSDNKKIKGVMKKDENGEKYREVVPEDYGERWYERIIVRREIRVSEDYEPDIVPILSGLGYGCSLNRVAAKAYEDMYYAAETYGYILEPYSAYRSYETQYTNFTNRIALWQSEGYSKQQAIENTVEVIMAPGGSEHNLGLAVDIIDTDYDFDQTTTYKWLTDNAYKYGFIERYPRDTRDITGVVREPWHWRYVGKRVAAEMHNSGLTFEEYLTGKGIEY